MIRYLGMLVNAHMRLISNELLLYIHTYGLRQQQATSWLASWPACVSAIERLNSWGFHFFPSPSPLLSFSLPLACAPSYRSSASSSSSSRVDVRSHDFSSILRGLAGLVPQPGVGRLIQFSFFLFLFLSLPSDIAEEERKKMSKFRKVKTKRRVADDDDDDAAETFSFLFFQLCNQHVSTKEWQQ